MSDYIDRAKRIAQLYAMIMNNRHSFLDKNVDRNIKAQQFSSTMAEKSQRMAIERARFALEAAQTRLQIISKAIQNENDFEKLAAHKQAQREMRAAIKTCKRNMYVIRKKGKRIEEYAEGIEPLMWGAMATQFGVKRGWRNLFSLIRLLPYGVQRTLITTENSVGAYQFATECFPVANPDGPVAHGFHSRIETARTLMERFKVCKDMNYGLHTGSGCQKEFFKIMEVIETSSAQIVAEHMEAIEHERLELSKYRDKIWAKNQVA